jgi:hypothetical protein
MGVPEVRLLGGELLRDAIGPAADAVRCRGMVVADTSVKESPKQTKRLPGVKVSRCA